MTLPNEMGISKSAYYFEAISFKISIAFPNKHLLIYLFKLSV